VTLVGIVSFKVWPSGTQVGSGVNVELSTPTPKSSAAPATPSATGPTVRLGSPTAVTGSGTAAGTVVTGNQGGGNGHPGNGGRSKPAKPPTVTVPPTTDDFSNNGDIGSTPSTPGTSSKDPSHPIQPVHSERPHQNISDGTNGKDDPSTGDGSDDVIAGKGPFTRPTPPSPPSNNAASSDDGDSYGGHSNGHGSSHSHH
jgi:hypothetical protein